MTSDTMQAKIKVWSSLVVRAAPEHGGAKQPNAYHQDRQYHHLHGNLNAERDVAVHSLYSPSSTFLPRPYPSIELPEYEYIWAHRALSTPSPTRLQTEWSDGASACRHMEWRRTPPAWRTGWGEFVQIMALLRPSGTHVQCAREPALLYFIVSLYLILFQLLFCFLQRLHFCFVTLLVSLFSFFVSSFLDFFPSFFRFFLYFFLCSSFLSVFFSFFTSLLLCLFVSFFLFFFLSFFLS
jgi:hypothetical protein